MENKDKQQKLIEIGNRLISKSADDETIKAGDLVEWKEGLKNKRYPLEGEPAFVVEILDRPEYDQDVKTSGTAYFREPLTIILGVIDPEGDFMTYYYDKRRFKKCKSSKG